MKYKPRAKPLVFYITTSQAAELIGCHRRTVIRLVQDGRLKGIHTEGKDWRGNSWLVSYESVMKWINGLDNYHAVDI